MQLSKTQCNQRCSADDIIGVLSGTNAKEGARDFTITLNQPDNYDSSADILHGTGKWRMDGASNDGNDITYAYDASLPDRALVITGTHYNKDGSDNITRFIPGDSCSELLGQKGVNGPDIKGFNMRLTKQ